MGSGFQDGSVPCNPKLETRNSKLSSYKEKESYERNYANGDKRPCELIFDAFEESAVGPGYPPPFDSDAIEANPYVELNHRQKDGVESQPPSSAYPGSAFGRRDGQVGQDGPHVNAAHDEDDHGGPCLKHPQPRITVVKPHAVSPEDGLLAALERHFPGSQDEVEKENQHDDRPGRLDQVVVLQEFCDSVHHPRPEVYAGHQNHMAPHEQNERDSREHLQEIQKAFGTHRLPHLDDYLVWHRFPLILDECWLKVA